MTEKKDISGKSAELRKLAEQKAAQSQKNTGALSSEEIQNLLHELRVHQIELEIQNDELRTSQAELETARTRYFDLYDLAPVGYFTLSEQGVILEVNLTAAVLLDTPVNSLKGRPFPQFIIPENRDIYHLKHRQLLKSGEMQSLDLRMLKKDGTAFWAHLLATAAQDTDSAPVCRVALSDITERKVAEEGLMKMSRLLSASQKIAHLGSFEYVPDTQTTVWSEEEFNIYGLDPSGPSPDYEVMLAKYIHPEDASLVREAFTSAIRSGSVYELEHRIVRPDGSVRLVYDRAHPLFDSKGRLLRYIGATLDITDRKKAEEEKANLELQLRQSQKMEAVGQLASGISHDFNNLLSIINGYSDLLIKNPALPENAKHHIKEIKNAGELATGLTRQLLLFSRHQPVDVRIMDLDAIVSDIEKMLCRLVEGNITLNRRIRTGLWQIKADPGGIGQVIMNLSINASDAMPDGGTLTIETENVQIDESNRGAHPPDIDPGLYVMLSVSDTGSGMNDEVRSHIFEPFFTTKEVGKGTGLGLATVYGIVKQSNAHIDVQSEIGKGTTFRIYFPKVPDVSSADEEPVNVEIAPRGTETVLLAEDEKDLHKMLQDFLQSLGYSVIPACNGKEALELAENHKGRIHLLLTDVVMPGMNGFELAKQIRKLSPEIKILFMTGYAKMTSTQKMMKTSDNFIHKPIVLHSLAVYIREVLDAATSAEDMD